MDTKPKPTFSDTVPHVLLDGLHDTNGEPFDAILILPYGFFEGGFMDDAQRASVILAKHLLYLTYDLETDQGELAFPGEDGPKVFGKWAMNHAADWKRIQEAFTELMAPALEILGKDKKGEEKTETSSANSVSEQPPASDMAMPDSGIPASSEISDILTGAPDSDGSWPSPASAGASGSSSSK